MSSGSDYPQWKRRDTLLMVGLAVAALAARLYWGLSGDGIFHPDEIYQTLEPAHELVYGFGLHAWEWDIGARNWALPTCLAAIWQLVDAAGFHRPSTYMPVIRAVVAGVFSTSVAGSYLLARQHGASRLMGGVGAALVACNPVAVYLGYRPLSGVISAPLVVFGLWAALHVRGEDRGRRWIILGMSLLGIAVMFRLQNALFAAIVAGVWRFRGPAKRYRLAMRVLVAWALVYGLVDWMSWGLPFESAGSYVRFNLLMDGTTGWYGADSVWFYPEVFVNSMGAAGVLLLVMPLLAWSRARLLAGCTVGFLAAHWCFPHKDVRFIVVCIPLMGALSAVGMQVVADRIGALFGGDSGPTNPDKATSDQAKPNATDDADQSAGAQPSRGGRGRLATLVPAVVALAAAGCALGGLMRIDGLTFGDLGQAATVGVDPARSAFDYTGPVNRLLSDAAQRPDICGLYLVDRWAVDAGGHTYFHRDVPLFHQGNPPAGEVNYNYVVAAGQQRPGWRPVAERGEYTLYFTGRHRCDKPADYRPVIYQKLE